MPRILYLSLLLSLLGSIVFCDDTPPQDCSFCPRKSNCIAAIPNSPDSFNTKYGWISCVCKEGYSGDGWRCQEVNECDEFDPCPPNAFCVDRAPDATDFPQYKCACFVGFVELARNKHGATTCGLPGDTLEPSVSPTLSTMPTNTFLTLSPSLGICGTLCPPKSVCVLTDASNPLSFEREGQLVTCICDDGYVGDGWRCEAMNECILDPNPCPFEGSVCVNTDPENAEFPKYKCNCSDDYEVIASDRHGATSCKVITPEPSTSQLPSISIHPTVTHFPSISQFPTVSQNPTVSMTIAPTNSLAPTDSPAPSPVPTMLPSYTYQPSLVSNLVPTVSNEPSISNAPSVTAFPSISPSLSQLPSETIFPSVSPSTSQEPSMTTLPSSTPS